MCAYNRFECVNDDRCSGTSLSHIVYPKSQNVPFKHTAKYYLYVFAQFTGIQTHPTIHTSMASALFEKSSLSKLRFTNKPRPIRIMVVGQRGVGKTGKHTRTAGG